MEHKVKILVVEDDPLTAADITHTLAEFGYSVIGPFPSGEEALEHIDKSTPDLILMDIILSGEIDGIKTIEEIQKKKLVPVVFLSALDDEVILQRAKFTNPYGYLIKPFDKKELKISIEFTLQRTSYEKNKDFPAVANSTSQFESASITTGIGSDEIKKLLRKLKLFDGVSQKGILRLSRASRIKVVSAAEYVTFEGEHSQGGFIPVSGRMSVTKTSSSGKELIVTLLAPGDVYGLLTLLPGLSGSTAARAQIDSKVIWISKNEWEAVLEEEPQVYKNLTHCLAERLASAHILSSSLAHARVEARIVSAILALLPEFGKGSSQEENEGKIYITRKELSELTGTTPETAIRVTKALERQELLDLSRAGIIKIPNIQQLENSMSN